MCDTNIFNCCNNQSKANLLELFGKACKNGKVKADWLTGKLLIPQGTPLFYAHSAGHQVYQGQAELIFQQGQLMEVKHYDNSPSRPSAYSQDNQKLQHYLYHHIHWNKLPKQDTKIKGFIQFSANQEGVIDSIKVVKGFNALFDKEAIRVVKSIPA